MIVMRGSVFLLATASALSVSTAAFAQDTGPQTVSQDEAEAQAEASDIVVTGTLIRGQAPTGSQIVSVGAAEIAAQGFVNSSQILSSITQDVNFNGRPQVGTFTSFQTVNRPTLRYLGASNAGGSSTLLLLDGHRLPGMGIYQTTPDLDAITPGAIERIETVTGGGSATYGSDAVGGVMNIISRRRYDGLEVGGHYGIGDEYSQWDVSVTGGKTWDNFSVWGSYSYSHNDEIRFRDRDYARNRDYVNGGIPGDTACPSPNIIQPLGGGNSLVIPIINGVPGAPGLGNRCDNFLVRTFFPEMSRHSAMAGVSAELGENVTFDVRGYFAHRKSYATGGPSTYSITTNPQTFQSVTGSFANLFGPETYSNTTLKTWGITPQVTVKLGGDWQMVAFYNYGKGISRYSSQGGINSSALQTAFNNGNFDPFTGTFANTPDGQAALALQTNRFGFTQGVDEIHNGRVTFEGPLFALGGGDARAALGAEILHDEYKVGSANGIVGQALFTERSNNRTVKSLFGELSLPLVGPDNAGGIHSFTVSLSGRYDHYSDVGGTFNPKVAVDWQPVAGWTIRGNWSRSYQAPSLAERNDVAPATFNSYQANLLGYAAPSNQQALFLYPGSIPGLRPQRAETWEIGTDIKPESIPGLSISATYYNIKFKDRIGNPPFFNAAVFLAQFPNNYILAPTKEQIEEFAAEAEIGIENAAQFINNPTSVYGLFDARSTNLSSLNTSGFDFSVNYTRPTSFGSVFGQVSGSRVLTYNVLAFEGGPTTNLSQNSVAKFRFQTMLGATVGKFTGRATLQHTSGYDIAPTVANLQQNRIGGLTVVNLAFNYNFENEGILGGTSLSLNIDNVFDTDPPRFNGVVNTSTPGFAGFTLGRVFQVGVRKKF